VAFDDDAALVAAITGGGPDRHAAEEAFCARFAGRVRRYAERHLRDPQAALDLAHDVLLTTLEAMRGGRIEKPDRLGSFVLTTCRHLVWDENRARGRRERLDRVAAPGLPVDVIPMSVGDRIRLEECVGRLEPRERSVILLSYAEDWPSDRVAAHLGTSPGNVRVIRHRSLSQLALCMEPRS